MPEFAQPGWLAALPLLPLLAWLQLRGGRERRRGRSMAAALLRVLVLAALLVALAGPLERTRSRS